MSRKTQQRVSAKLQRLGFRMPVAQWLRRGMAESGLKQEALSEKSGVNRTTISQILNCHADARQKTLEALSTAMSWPLPGEDLAVQQPSILKSGDPPVTARGKSQTPPNARGAELVIARRVGRVIQRVIEKDEADGTREGREAVARALMDFGRKLRELRGSPDVADIYELAEDIREGRLK
jgi:transcriptional regulator with XRE-family HTH domain